MDPVTVGLSLGSGLCAFGAAVAVLDPRGSARSLVGGSRDVHLAELLGHIPLVAGIREHEDLRLRRVEALKQMPTLLDILNLGLTAGLSFDASLELYCQRYHNGLAASFSEALLTWRIGSTSRAEALGALAEELDVAALRRFASAVAEALAFGTPLASALEQQAQAIRDEQRAQVEEEIEKVPVKMLIPLGTLILPAMLLAILGPLIGPALGV